MTLVCDQTRIRVLPKSFRSTLKMKNESDEVETRRTLVRRKANHNGVESCGMGRMRCRSGKYE